MENSSHWYDAEGNSRHTLVGKNGKDRAPTIKDARELGLYPSVTTVLKAISNGGLDRWRIEQVALAAQKTDQNLAPEIFVSKVIEKAFEQVGDAADLGTEIHLALEQHFQGQPFDPAMFVYVEAVDKWVKANQITFTGHELRLVNKTVGYAGTTDAAFKAPNGYGILDFKSRKTIAGKKVESYDTQILQIAAYHVAHFGPITEMDTEVCGVNVYISTTEPGRVEAVWYDRDALSEAWIAFFHINRVWQYLKAYNPAHNESFNRL